MVDSGKDKRNVVQLPEGVPPFIYVTKNEFLWRKHKKLREEDIAICECKYDASDPNSACVGRCLNVLTNIECTPGYCRCGESCRNQRFQKCEYAKTKLFRTEGRGWGLLADENIKAGQFIIECCGEVISFEEAKKRSHTYDVKDTYIISLHANYFIDATCKGNFARFINHSCRPNCETRKWIVSGETRVGIFAKEDICVGMELTYNYNFKWYYGGANVHCLCGAANCCIFLGAKSQLFQEYNHVWEDGDDRYIVEDVPLYDSSEDESFLVTSGNEHSKQVNDGDLAKPFASKEAREEVTKHKEYGHVWEDGDDRYMVDDIPLYDSADDESFLVISGNEPAKILNDSEGSTFTSEPSNSTSTKKKSQRGKPKLKGLKMADPGWNYGKKISETNRHAVECQFCKKVTNGGIFRHKQHLIGTYRDVSRCEACPEAVREEIKKFVDEKKERKLEALSQSNVINLDDDED